MNLYDLMNKEAILAKAFEHPALRIKPKSEYRPDIDVALKAVVGTIEYLAMTAVGEIMRPRVEDLVQFQILMNGEWADCEDKDEWESAIDDAVEKAIEDFVPILSADWLGRNTIATGLHEEGGIDRFLKAMSKEVFKQLTYEKTPVQVMSNAGILRADVEVMLEAHLKQTPQEQVKMSEQNNDLQAVIEAVAGHVGKEYDILEITSEFDLASDEDDILAMGAGKRLGLAEEDVAVLQAERVVHGDETATVMHEMLATHFKENPTEKPRKPRAPAKPRAAKAEPSAIVDAQVMATVRDNGAKDGDMATLMGVSRATYNNWTNGKAVCQPADQHRAALRGVVVEKINALHEALRLLDGTELDMVF